MPLPPAVPRQSAHVREVRFEGYEREDGLWDIEGRVTDVKPYDCELASGIRPAGEPIHDMRVRLTIDASMNVLEAVASSDRQPYPGFCEVIAPAYSALVGANLAMGFRKRVQALFSGVQGCTHITELLSQFPTAALQSFAGRLRDTDDSRGKPFQLDRCHALDTRGDTVKTYYPRWHAPAGSAGGVKAGPPGGARHAHQAPAAHTKDHPPKEHDQ